MSTESILGDAFAPPTTDASPTATEVAEVSVESAVQEHFESRATANKETSPIADAQKEPVVSSPTDQEVAEVVPEDAEDETLTDEEKELAELKKYAENPNTPAFARVKIEQALKFNESLKSQYSEKEAQYVAELDELRNSKSYDDEALSRYQQYEEDINVISSVLSKPEQVLETVQRLNPRVFPQVQQHLIWNAIIRADGSPDHSNIQALVDGLTGYDGVGERVSSKDVLAAIDALQNKRIDPLDFDEYYDDAQREAVARARKLEAENQRRQAQLNDELARAETRTRQSLLGQEVSAWQGQVKSHIDTHLSKFHLTPSASDPLEAKEFKADLQEKIRIAISKAESKSPYFKELSNALEVLSNGEGKQSTAEVEKEIKQFFSSPVVKSKVNAGIAEVNRELEQVILREARRYKLLMKGLETTQREKVGDARPIPRTSSNTPVASQMTAEQVAQMTAAERRDMQLRAMSDELRNLGQRTGTFG